MLGSQPIELGLSGNCTKECMSVFHYVSFLSVSFICNQEYPSDVDSGYQMPFILIMPEIECCILVL